MIIGITGQMRSGKSTFARHLCKALPNSVIDSLAAPIKELAHEITAPRTGNDAADKEKIRPLYQAIGETMKQLYGRNYWLNMVEFKHKLRIDSGTEHVIIDDLRFPFEAEFITKMGGYVIKLQRENNIETPASQHVSETMVPQIVANQTICNNGTMNELIEAAQRVAQAII